ncbi:MAG: 3-deoxy-manno-octulosonate cytidylyltransferase [Vicinamibacteria bacterium]|nr:3-deoxy-manno-octulosonate cytidylyltransferase [Vicinamibacteria bacterium]
MRVAAIIPARFASTRLPGKPLSLIHGWPMVRHVYERARRAKTLDDVVIATDDPRVMDAVAAFGGRALMTSPSCPTGTDRLAEASKQIEADIYVNVQGDEPMIDPDQIDAAVNGLLADAEAAISTLSLPLRTVEEMMSDAVVKVVTDARRHALYFSRSPIPHGRTTARSLEAAAGAAIASGMARKHVGLYVFRREALAAFARLSPSAPEALEQLEQLRALHHGLTILVEPVEGEGTVAVDTPEDLERARALISPILDIQPTTQAEA